MRGRFAWRSCAAALALLAGLAPAPAADAADRLVRLDAVLAEGGEPIYDAMAIGIWRLDDGEPVERVAERHAAPAEITLAPGRYRVQAEYGKARRVRDITVAPEGAARRTINLEAGKVRLQLLARPGGPPVAGAVSWEIRRYRRGEAQGRKVAAIRDAQPKLRLAAGWYEVAAHYGEAKVQHAVEVTAGRSFTYAIVLGGDAGG